MRAGGELGDRGCCSLSGIREGRSSDQKPARLQRYRDAGTYRQPEEALRSGDDEWSAIIALHLPPKKVEVLRWGGRVCNMHIDACCFLAIVIFNRIVRELQAIQFRSVPLTSGRTNLLEACVRIASKNVPVQHHRVHAGAVQQDHFASPIWLRGIKYINAQGRR